MVFVSTSNCPGQEFRDGVRAYHIVTGVRLGKMNHGEAQGNKTGLDSRFGGVSAKRKAAVTKTKGRATCAQSNAAMLVNGRSRV